MNRVILNQDWGILKEMLTYKQAWLGGELILARGHRVLACGEAAVTQLGEARTCFVSDCKTPILN